MIGTDGIVTKSTSRGKRALAGAAVRACSIGDIVPNELKGQAVEAETTIVSASSLGCSLISFPAAH